MKRNMFLYITFVAMMCVLGMSTANAQSEEVENSGDTMRRGQDFTETAFDLNMRMVYVEGGTFTMGCTSEQGKDCDCD